MRRRGIIRTRGWGGQTRLRFLLGQGVAPFTPPPPAPVNLRGILTQSPRRGVLAYRLPGSLKPKGRSAVEATRWAQLGAQGFSPKPEGGAASVPGFPMHYSRCLLARGKERREEGRRGEQRGGEGGAALTSGHAGPKLREGKQSS